MDTLVIDQPQVVKEEKVEQPPMYAIILHNDDSTGPHFVALVLKDVFRIDAGTAWDIMMVAHRNGQAMVHLVTKEVAETEINNAKQLAVKAGPKDYASHIVSQCELTFTMEAS